MFSRGLKLALITAMLASSNISASDANSTPVVAPPPAQIAEQSATQTADKPATITADTSAVPTAEAPVTTITKNPATMAAETPATPKSEQPIIQPENKPAALITAKPSSRIVTKPIYMVCAGRYGSRTDAEKYMGALEKFGYSPRVEMVGPSDFRVVLAKESNRSTAEKKLKDFKKDGISCFIEEK